MRAVRKDEERGALIDRMLGAGTARDAEDAYASADAWLVEHPGDVRVLAAQERLEGKAAGMREPDRAAEWATLAAYAGVFSVATIAAFALTGGVQAAGLAGLIAAFTFPWDAAGDAIAERRRRTGRENGER